MSNERYVLGWSDPRTIYNSAVNYARRYGEEAMDEPALSYAKSLGASLQNTKARLMGEILQKQKRRYEGYILKVDAHKYKTEAKDLPIEACQSMWIIRYGDGAVDASVLVEQDDLIWEIGNRLFWAGLLEHDTQTDRYTCKL